MFQFTTEGIEIHGGEIVRVKDVAVSRKKSQLRVEVQQWVDEVAQNQPKDGVDEDMETWTAPDWYRQMSKDKWAPSRPRIFVYDGYKMALRIYYPPFHLL